MSPNYKLLNASLSEVRAAIPSHLFVRKTSKGLGYLVRDLAQAIVLFFVTSLLEERLAGGTLHVTLKQSLHTALITFYWWFQDFGLLGTNWKISHHRHHANHGSMERDEVYVPKTRQDLGIPALSEHKNIDYSEYISDTPLYNLLNLVLQQLSAFPAYLLYNVSGQKTYPRWTGHWNPRCVLFRDSHFLGVMISNAAIIAMLSITYFATQVYGFAAVFNFITPHPKSLISRKEVGHSFAAQQPQSTAIFLAGKVDTSCTMVRMRVRSSFLIFENISTASNRRRTVAHFHVIHHFFPKMPWCEYQSQSCPGFLNLMRDQITARRQQPTYGVYSVVIISPAKNPFSEHSGALTTIVNLSKTMTVLAHYWPDRSAVLISHFS
ncbi:hypothetical protein PQX77_014878 [Marasmius sp. AFHP31]|nr:hypothetical protein PQX77_014878 [Marasmius sp. AFHP31]